MIAVHINYNRYKIDMLSHVAIHKINNMMLAINQ